MRAFFVSLLGLGVAIAGCGGGGGGGDEEPAAEPITLVCHVVPGRQATTRADGFVHTAVIDVGDYFNPPDEIGVRAIYGFDIQWIPVGARIQLARLTLSIASTDGEPFLGLGNLWVEHVDVGAEIDSSDYDRTAITPAVDFIGSHPGSDPFSFEVTAAVQADVDASWSTCDLRLGFSKQSNEDGTHDFLRLPVVAPGANDVRLVVSYFP